MKRKKIERENRRINRVTVACMIASTVTSIIFSLIQQFKPEPPPKEVIVKHYYYQAPLPKQIERNNNEIRPSERLKSSVINFK